MLKCSLVIPAYNEGKNIIPNLNRILEHLKISFECLIIVDYEGDPTIDAITNSGLINENFRVLINDFGPGPANAIKFGISKASAEVVVVTMADGSDDPRVIPDLVSLVERGVVIACASRYMAGGQQIGAPFLKGVLSRIAGISLYYFANVGTKDATNSFKAYSKKFLDKVSLDSKYGFEMGLELVAKAKRMSLPVAELPTIWIEQGFRTSNFKLASWVPKYLRWYLYALKIGKGGK